VSRFPGSVITDCKDKADDVFKFRDSLPRKVESDHRKEKDRRRISPGQLQLSQDRIQAAGGTKSEHGDQNGRVHVRLRFGRLGRFHLPQSEDLGGNRDQRQRRLSDFDGHGNAVDARHGSQCGRPFERFNQQRSRCSERDSVRCGQGRGETRVFRRAGRSGQDAEGGRQDEGVCGRAHRQCRRVAREHGSFQMPGGRGGAVVDHQVRDPPDRLQCFGAGPYAPIASNDSEDGCTPNRRVEPVTQ
jgi:hypothetical protein